MVFESLRVNVPTEGGVAVLAIAQPIGTYGLRFE